MKVLKGALRAPFFISSRGFSLVELMIVVAIIGLLSSIAIPNFQKFQARSKTTEAKLQLAAVYTAEASFYGHYQIFHQCLRYMGYDPVDFKSSRFYSVGFVSTAAINGSAYSSAVTLDLNATDCAFNMPPTTDATFYEAGTGVGQAVATSAHIPATALGDQTIAQMTYSAGAGGIIHKAFTSSSNSSAFTINELKKISTIRIGY